VQRKHFGIAFQRAGPGSLDAEFSLPGEIVFNEDRVVHLVPRVAGIVIEVTTTVGDHVEEGELLAMLDSRELADAKGEYLASEARAGMAKSIYERERALRETQVSSEQDLLDAQQTLAEADIALRSAKLKLRSLGLPEEAVDALDMEHDDTITQYEIRSPIDGIVTERHLSLGESVDGGADIFTIVDLSSVWVNLTVYTKNLGAVRVGSEVVVNVDHSGATARGVVAMVPPFVEESTRSATARVVLANEDGRWMPGTFVTGYIRVSEEELNVVLPRNAVQTIEGEEVVFVEHEGAFEPVPVTTGKTDREFVEIVKGLKPGSRYVAEGAFELKAALVTSNLDPHAGHGH
jgi:cobalt-zinc-cadmium efflux system membrane fusion protein